LDQAPDGKVLKAGLIGCGGRGTGAAINFLDADPNLQITALGDVFQDKIDNCRAKLKEEKDVEIAHENCFLGFDSFEKVIDSGVDLVLLCTPPHFRAAHVEAAVNARKHIFMEKPVGVDPVGARSVLASSKKAESIGLNMVSGTIRRVQKDYMETQRMVANGMIGEIVGANILRNGGALWYRERQPEWSDMEYMLRNWNNFTWLSGDHILDTHIHNIDVVNWFMEATPDAAIGYGGRHRRVTGDQFDFFSVSFEYGHGKFSHSMCRQIDNCANGVGEIIIGTEGYTNCQNTIYRHDGSIKWQYQYPNDKDGNPTSTVKISPYIQEHIHLVTAIRTNHYVNEGEQTALSNLTAIMGRESAYTGKRITWDEIYNSGLKLGPEDLSMSDVSMTFEPPVPGTPIREK